MANERHKQREPAPTGEPTPGEASFEEILARLEAIAKRLEAGETRLEDALSLYEEGVRLARLGAERLDAAEKKLEVLREQGRIEPLVADERSVDD